MGLSLQNEIIIHNNVNFAFSIDDTLFIKIENGFANIDLFFNLCSKNFFSKSSSFIKTKIFPNKFDSKKKNELDILLTFLFQSFSFNILLNEKRVLTIIGLGERNAKAKHVF